jgi:hypothetical protein
MKSADWHAMPPPGDVAVRNVVTAVRGCSAGCSGLSLASQ